MKFLFLVLVFGIANAKPTDELFDQETLEELIKEAEEDIQAAILSKTGALSFMGESMVNFTLNTTNLIEDYFGNLDLNVDLDLDLESSLNSTEESIKEKKKAVIEALFHAKRQVLKTLG